MGTTIIFRRGENDPTSGSGLTLAEPAFNTTLKTFHIGLGHGITAAWVGAPISGLSADIAAGITYKIPSAAAVKNYIGGLCYGNTGAPTITQYVSSFNGLTGAVGGVCAAQANTFTAVQTFTSGISAAGGITFNGTLNGATATFSRLTTHTAGMSGGINISSSNATGNMYLLMARGAGVTAVFMDNATTPLVYQPSAGNLGLKGITLVSANDYLYITPTQITATNTVTPSSALFYFIAEGGNYFQSPNLSQIGDLSGQNSALALNINPSTRTMTWGDGVLYTGVTSGFFGVNRSDAGMCADYAVEINSPTGKGLQLIYNNFTGAASNWVNMDVSSGGNYTLRPSGGLATVTGTLNVSAGVCAAGATFTGTMIGATATFSHLTTHSAGLSAAGITCNGDINLYGNRSIVHRGTAFVLKGITTGAALSSNSVLLSGNQVDLQLNSSTGYVLVDRGWETALSSYNTGIKFNSYDDGGPDYGTITLQTNGANNATINLPSANGTLALTSQLMGAVNGSTAATTAVTSFNGLTGAVTGVTVGGVNTFTKVNTFSEGISAAGSTFASTTNTLDVIASTEGAGLRIARATSGAFSRIGGIRLGRSTTTNLNTYLEGSAGTFSLYNGVDNTGTLFASFSPTQFSLGTTSASFITLNSPNLISFGDQGAVGNNQAFSMSGTARTYTFGDFNGITTGFVGINRSGLCADYALEVNSPTGKGLQLIYNDHTGAASNWVNMDVSSGGNFTVRPSGGLATVTGTLNVSAGVCAAGATLSGLLSASAGISAAGTTAATFNGTVNCNSSTVYKPTLQYYNEPVSNPTITGNALTLDLSAAQVFGVTLNSPINTFTISNTPTTANRSIGFSLIFTADGTARGVTWGSAVKWSGGVSPTLTSTNGKKDILTFLTINGGSEWLGFIAGQNF